MKNFLDIPSLSPIKRLPKNFWKPCIDDFVCVLMPVSTLIIWGICAIIGHWDAPFCYWDGPNYVYAAKTLYRIPDKNPWTSGFGYPPSYFACHLPGLPIIIRIISTICLNSFWIGNALTILLIPAILAFVFRRLLIVYGAVTDPTWTTALLSLVPLRFLIYHSVGASEPLFMLYSFLAFIFFKSDQILFVVLALCGACITRVEGLIMVGTIGLCYLLRLDLLKSIITGLSLLSYVLLVVFHKIRFGIYDAYIKFNQGRQKLIGPFPFFELIRNAKQGMNVSFLSCYYLYLPFIVGSSMLLSNVLPFAIMCIAYILYVSLLFHIDILRYSIPAYVLALLVGFDPILSSPQGKRAIKYLVPLYIVIALRYSVMQICSNRAPLWFMKDALRVPTVYF